MLFLLSPSKKIDQNNSKYSFDVEPIFTERVSVLVNELKRKSVDELSSLMKISQKLSELNFDRYLNWENSNNCMASAFFSFSGDVYKFLDPYSLELDDLYWAQDHFIILSGLYGLLRPLDLMKPYRLDMGVKLRLSCGRDLYEFWKNEIASYINRYQQKNNSNIVLNLSSNEYFKVIDSSILNTKVVNCIFQDFVGDHWRVVGVKAKRARGLVARYIISNRVVNLDELKKNTYGGYTYISSESREDCLVFRHKI
ncbi:MAG: peroxide stress protein YaaA [Candidatus Kinetoplastibacterium crithidii]|nr:MAG: peroxide stress protein YaaA [Candidatus Kinetoplastibacterium crithidii]